MAIKEELSRFLQNTSVKGIPRLYKAESTTLKLLWGIAVAACLTTGFFLTYCLLDAYFSYPTVTQIKERHYYDQENVQLFPNIQVCNLNPSELLDSVHPDKTIPEYKRKVLHVTSCQNCSEEDKKVWPSIGSILNSPKGYLQFLGGNQAQNILQNISDFLIDCRVFPHHASCSDVGNISVVLSSQHLACLSLAFPRGVFVASVSMTFYIGFPKSHLPQVGAKGVASAGIIYELTEPESGDNVFIRRSTALPGQMTNVYINKEVTKRLPDPYGDCLESAENYNFELCTNTCYDSFIRKHCNCTDLYDLSHFKERNSDNNTKDYCYSIYLSRSQLIANHKCLQLHVTDGWTFCYKSCKYRCVTIKYTNEVTLSKWPLPGQHEAFYSDFIASKSKKMNAFSNDGDGRSNLGNLNKSREALVEDSFLHIQFDLNFDTYLQYEEVPLYTISSLMGTVGGVLNLWAGITVIVLVEIMEAFINVAKAKGASRDGKLSSFENSRQSVPVLE